MSQVREDLQKVRVAEFVRVLSRTMEGLSDRRPAVRRDVYGRARRSIELTIEKQAASNPSGWPDALRAALEQAISQVEAGHPDAGYLTPTPAAAPELHAASGDDVIAFAERGPEPVGSEEGEVETAAGRGDSLPALRRYDEAERVGVPRYAWPALGLACVAFVGLYLVAGGGRDVSEPPVEMAGSTAAPVPASPAPEPAPSEAPDAPSVVEPAPVPGTPSLSDGAGPREGNADTDRVGRVTPADGEAGIGSPSTAPEPANRPAPTVESPPDPVPPDVARFEPPPATSLPAVPEGTETGSGSPSSVPRDTSAESPVPGGAPSAPAVVQDVPVPGASPTAPPGPPAVQQGGGIDVAPGVVPSVPETPPADEPQPAGPEGKAPSVPGAQPSGTEPTADGEVTPEPDGPAAAGPPSQQPDEPGSDAGGGTSPEPAAPDRSIDAMPPEEPLVVVARVSDAVPGASWATAREPAVGTDVIEDVVEARVRVPAQGVDLTVYVRRNVDPSIPAVGIVEMVFREGSRIEGQAIASVGAAVAGRKDGDPSVLVAFPVAVGTDHFVMTLTAVRPARERNLELLRDADWIDFPVNLADGTSRRVRVETGVAGKDVIRAVLAGWPKE